LGILIDERLSWKDHIKSLCTRIRRFVGIFYKVRHIVPEYGLKMLYFALVYSVIQYGVELYANTKITYLHDLTVLNNRVLRTLQLRNIRTRLEELYKSYNTLPVCELHDYKLCIFVFKFLFCKETLPLTFRNYFTLNLSIHDHNTRTSTNIHIQRYSTGFGKRALFYRAAILWNKLPNDVKVCTTISVFKNRLKTYFINSVFS
jgi:hypothetical protein